MESSSSLTIKTHDLGERLSNDHLESLVEEVPQANSILIEVARDEALIGGIEEWIELVCSANLSDLLPLVEGWINTSWVVSASVEEHHGSWSGILEVSNHAVEIETLGLLVEVSVLSNVEASRSKD